MTDVGGPAHDGPIMPERPEWESSADFGPYSVTAQRYSGGELEGQMFGMDPASSVAVLYADDLALALDWFEARGLAVLRAEYTADEIENLESGDLQLDWFAWDAVPWAEVDETERYAVLLDPERWPVNDVDEPMAVRNVEDLIQTPELMAQRGLRWDWWGKARVRPLATPRSSRSASRFAPVTCPENDEEPRFPAVCGVPGLWCVVQASCGNTMPLKRPQIDSTGLERVGWNILPGPSLSQPGTRCNARRIACFRPDRFSVER